MTFAVAQEATDSAVPILPTDHDVIALACADRVGDIVFRTLVREHRTASAALASRPIDEVDRARHRADAIMESARRTDIRIRASTDASYPATLLDLPDPPRLLFSRGDDPSVEAPHITIVGTRTSSEYGERVTRELASSIARAGGVVVSGMARGIDAIAHEGALTERKLTIAVLGTGADVPYPAGHRALYRRILETGAVFSELPPGTRATPGSFPRRNRILAALSRLTIVVEAGAKSGALITASAALELDRHLGAVPGPIDVSESIGTNELLRDGASVIASVADALALAGLTAPVRVVRDDWPADQRAIWTALARGALDMDTLASRTRLPARECMTAVTALELAGAIECTLTGEVRRR